MQVPIQITIRDIPHSKAIEAHLFEKAQKLNQFSDKIIACNIVVEQIQKHQHTGKLYNTRIYVSLPRKVELAINHNQDENLYLSIHRAFDGMIRKIEDAMKKMQGDVKVHDDILEGKVVRLFRADDFGFIEDWVGNEYYFNSSNVAHPSFSQLQVGEQVRFIERLGDEGPQAHRVKIKHRQAHG